MNTIWKNGPNRVMYNGHCDATTPARARQEYRVTPEIIFIRKDGWSLGAPKALEKKAYELWADEWIGFIRSGAAVRPISDYEEDA